MDGLLAGLIWQKALEDHFDVAARIVSVALHVADRLRLAVLVSGRGWRAGAAALRRIRPRRAIVAAAGVDAHQAGILPERLVGDA